MIYVSANCIYLMLFCAKILGGTKSFVVYAYGFRQYHMIR